jgi:hypothetical protein
MEALIAREQASGTQAAVAAKARKRPAGAANAKAAKPAAAASKSAKKRHAPAALDSADESADEDYDEEMAEHGSFEPVCMTDPKNAAAAEGAVGERVFIDGIVGRSDLNMSGAEIIGWRAKRKRWEVECDRGDERLLVESAHLWSLTSTAPAAKKKRAAGKRRGVAA